MKKTKLFIIGLLANTLENIILLWFFKIPVDQTVLVGASVFALATLLIYKLAEGSNNQKQNGN